MQHVYDNHIKIQKVLIETAARNGVVSAVDTTLLQVQVLEKFMHGQGYFLNDRGQFEDGNKKSPAKIVTFSTAVRAYNRFFKEADKEVLANITNGVWLERVYLAGKSLSRGIRVMKHMVKFI